MPTEVRPSMTDILGRIRRLIKDQPVADSTGTYKTVFSDEDVQDACDENREDVVYLELAQKPFQTPDSVTLYTDFYAQWKGGWWESNSFLQDSANNVIAATSVDYHLGRWIFATQPTYPIYLNGVWYDTYAIAADMLENWAADEKLNFDIQLDYQQFRRQQKFESLLELAQKYRQHQRVLIGTLSRSDLNPLTYGPGVSPVFSPGDSRDYRGWGW